MTATLAAPVPAPGFARPDASSGPRAATCDELLTKVAAGDRSAFDSLYDHLAPAAYGVALRIACNDALAQEITQDAFLQVWSTGGTFDQTRGSARAWVLTIVHRRAVDVVRHEQSARDRVLRVGIGALAQPYDSVWASAVQNSERGQVARALKSLSPAQQQAIELAYYQALTCGEVAQRLGIPLGTAKSRILEGVRRLRRTLTALEH